MEYQSEPPPPGHATGGLSRAAERPCACAHYQIFNSLTNGFAPTMAVAAILFSTVSALVFAAIARWGDLPRLMGADPARTEE